jgi:Tol biopolymer transport system component/DNA-binding winged helix-turn-helix (wHTH) protein
VTNQQPKHIYEFGPFRLDAAEHLLLRDGEAVPLTPKAFDLLLALVERHGHLLEKDELLKKVWPDTFVEEANLASNISQLRKALGDGENGERYIETAPKRGYRFVAGVREIGAEQAEINEVARSTREEARPEPLTSKVKRHRKGALLALAVSFIAFGGIAFGLYKFINRSESKSSGPEPTIIPVTSFHGNETQPAFAPDGNQIAFVWDGAQGDNQDIYVKLVDAGAPLRLTTDPAPDLNPVWSPDGRFIAFIREGASRGVYLIPALGGPERRLASGFPASLPNQVPLGNRLSWSPDGKFIAVAHKNSSEEPFSIFALAVETGEMQKLTSPPAGYVGDQRAAFSPDGKLLAFVRYSGDYVTDLYVAPVDGGEPQRLTFVRNIIFGLAWTADGREIVFSYIGPLGVSPSLWKAPAAGGTLERMEAVGRGVRNPAISRQGNRLAFAQASFDNNIWRLPLRHFTAGKAAPVRLISSTYTDVCPQYSPDGKRIVFCSDRSGRSQIWLCDNEGANPIQLTNLSHTDSGTPRWSPDGRQIAFDSLAEGNRDIYVVSADGGQPQRFTRESSEDGCPSWSRDGRWIYFGSNRSGSLQIWKAPAGGGQPAQVTKQGGFEGFESPDGRFFYYAKGRGIPGIWRIPVEGGAEAPVVDIHQAGLFRSWAVVEQGIYFVTAETQGRSLIEFFSFATGQVTPVAAPEKPIFRIFWGMAVSPDGQWLLFTQMDQQSSDIMLMENFR